jgi:hypothetical protein
MRYAQLGIRAAQGRDKKTSTNTRSGSTIEVRRGVGRGRRLSQIQMGDVVVLLAAARSKGSFAMGGGRQV